MDAGTVNPSLVWCPLILRRLRPLPILPSPPLALVEVGVTMKNASKKSEPVASTEFRNCTRSERSISWNSLMTNVGS